MFVVYYFVLVQRDSVFRTKSGLKNPSRKVREREFCNISCVGFARRPRQYNNTVPLNCTAGAYRPLENVILNQIKLSAVHILVSSNTRDARTEEHVYYIRVGITRFGRTISNFFPSDKFRICILIFDPPLPLVLNAYRCTILCIIHAFYWLIRYRYFALSRHIDIQNT